MSEIVLITITGKDKKGINSHFTNVLGPYNVNILDIGQSVIHEHILLGILIEIPDEKDFSSIFKDMLFEGHKMSLNVDLKPVELDRYETWVQTQRQERRIITLLGKKVTARQISKVTSVIAENDLNIEAIYRLTGRISLNNKSAASQSHISEPYFHYPAKTVATKTSPPSPLSNFGEGENSSKRIPEIGYIIQKLRYSFAEFLLTKKKP